MRATYVGRRGDALAYIVTDDNDGRPLSPVSSYVFYADRAIRTVSGPTGVAITKQVITLGSSPSCSCGRPGCPHVELAREKRDWLHNRGERKLLPPLDWPRLADHIWGYGDPRYDDRASVYDGGYTGAVPGRVAWDDRGIIDDGDPGDAGIAGVAGDIPPDFGWILSLAQRESARIAFPPRIIGGHDDLLQEALLAGLLEAKKSAALGLKGRRLHDRVAKAIRHRLIDLVRRQDAADRNLPQAPLSGQSGDDREIDPADPDGDPLEFLVRQEREKSRSRRDERTEAVLASAYQEVRHQHLHASGERRREARLARRILRRLWDHIVLGRRTRGTLDFESAPEYRRAVEIIKRAWGIAMSRVLSGAVPSPRGRRPRAA